MGQFFEYEMTVDSRDVDGWGRCRPSAVLGYLQEAATLAAEDGGFGREKTLEYHAFWTGSGSAWTAPCGGRRR
mgnify:CR=1 FL=1